MPAIPEIPTALHFFLHLPLVLVAGWLGGIAAVRLRQPAVLGELLAGIALGALPLPLVPAMRADTGLDLLAQLGVLLLLFQTGLESTVGQMLSLGAAALRVATVGVLLPLGLGWLAARALLPGEPMAVHAFLGATLTATSVGITARVLRDLHVAQTATARLILGAAVIDDVLGLVLLAVMSGLIGSGAMHAGAATLIFGKAAIFLVLSLLLGVWLAPWLAGTASRAHPRLGLLALGLALCGALSWLAALAGLATIVGAFVAGLVLDPRSGVELSGHVARPGAVLTPIFFVVMGLRTDLASLLLPSVPVLAAALIVVAVIGKIAAGIAAGHGVDRLAVGLGMIPRGEVGLIFASLGATLHVNGAPVVSPRIYSAVVATVVVTTLITPPLLRWRLARIGQSA